MGVLKLLDIQVGGVIDHEIKQEAMNEVKNIWTEGKGSVAHVNVTQVFGGSCSTRGTKEGIHELAG